MNRPPKRLPPVLVALVNQKADEHRSGGCPANGDLRSAIQLGASANENVTSTADLGGIARATEARLVLSRVVDLSLGQQIVVWGLRRLVHDGCGFTVEGEYRRVFGESAQPAAVALSILIKALGCRHRQREAIGALTDDRLTTAERAILGLMAAAQDGESSTIAMLLADEVPMDVARIVARNIETYAACLTQAGYRLPDVALRTRHSGAAGEGIPSSARNSLSRAAKQPTTGVVISLSRH